MAEPRFILLLGCFFLSGVAGLIYETAWTQEFALVFGASELAVVTVLAAYMAGLTLGASAAGRWSRRVARPVLAYAVLEAGIGVSALLIPTAVGLAGRLGASWFGAPELPPATGTPASAIFQLVSSFAILLVPTALMGATLPLLVRHTVDAEVRLGTRVGLLYAGNTVGAACGALLAAFALLPRLGLGGTVWAAVALSGLVSVLAGALASGRPRAVAAEDPPVALPAARGLILPLMAVSGAVSFCLEVVWTRLLSHVLGGSIYAFGTMLATFLSGIALGAAVASRLATTRERAWRGFAVAQLLVAALSVGAFLMVDRLADHWAGMLRGDFSQGVWLCALTLLPSTLGIGATFPLAVRILAAGTEDAGPATARVYTWNTLGAVIGAVGTGLFWLPALRFAGMFSAAMAASLAVALAAALLARPAFRPAAALALVGLACLGVLRLPTPWHVLRSSALVSPASLRADAEDESDTVEIRGKLVYYGVGRTATVMLREQGNEWRLTTNGLPESVIQPPGSRPSRYALARWMSLLPLALRPSARSLLVVGLGGGGSVENLPAAYTSVDVVELEPEVVAANRFLSQVRRVDPLSDPRVRLHLDDARSALRLGNRSYDAIVSQPSHPWTSGSSHLFTREFYQLASQRLRPGGVFVQWIGFAFVDEALFRTLMATLQSVFPSVEVYQPPMSGAALLVASSEPLDPASTAGDGIAAAAAAWLSLGVQLPEDLIAARVLDSEGCHELAGSAAPNTDHRNLFQTRSPRALAHPLTAAAANGLFAPVDALRRIPENVDALCVVRRLVEQRAFARALRLATVIADPETRRTAFALVDIGSGHAERGQAELLGLLTPPGHGAGELLAELDEAPASTDVPFSLLLSARLSVLMAGAPRPLAVWASRDPLARALLEGWSRLSKGRDGDVRDLEPELASVLPRHPAYAAATRLRVAWRAAAGDPAEAREGVRLLDALMAMRPGVGDALLRARLGARANDTALVEASLYELIPGLEAPGGDKKAAAEARRILDSVTGGDRGSRARLRERLVTVAEPQPAASSPR